MTTGTLRTVLVPLDGSELAARAIGPARQIAALHGASVLLLQVVPDRDPTERAARDVSIERAGRHLAGVADRLRVEGATVLVEVCAGRAAEQIVEQARLWRSDLVVMSTHGRSGLGALVHGSVADAVVRTADRPVLLVPVRGGSHPEISGDTILVPVDGSAAAEIALGRAAELARELAIPLTVLRAVSYPSSIAEGLAHAFAEIERECTGARAYVDGLVGALRRVGLEADGEVLLGSAAVAIGARGDARNAALIVMATHGRGALERLALGSVAHAVLAKTTHPVLLVRRAPAPAAHPAPVAEPQLAGALP